MALALMSGEQGANAIDQCLVPTDGHVHELLLVVPSGDGQLELWISAGAEGGGGSLQLIRATSWDIAPDSLHLDELWEQPRLEPVANWERHYGDPPATDGIARIRDLAWKHLVSPVVVPWIDDTRIGVVPSTGLFRSLAQSGLYEPGTALALRQMLPQQGGCFIDIGANVGVFSVLASRWLGSSGRVIAIEPSPREMAYLRANIALNPGGAAVSLSDFAIADVEGQTILRVADDLNGGLNTLGSDFAYPGVPTNSEVAVSVTTLDALLTRLSVDRIDVVKIDVEGAEMRVLSGAEESLRRFGPALIVEVFDHALRGQGASAADLQAYLQHRGYSLFAIDDGSTSLQSIDQLSANRPYNILAQR